MGIVQSKYWDHELGGEACHVCVECTVPDEVLLVEKPIVRRSVAELSAAMRQHPHDFALLRGQALHYRSHH